MEAIVLGIKIRWRRKQLALPSTKYYLSVQCLKKKKPKKQAGYTGAM
jgi:hypothetical protein